MRNFVLLPVSSRARELIMYSALLLLLACSSLSLHAQVKRPLDKKINFKVSNVSLADALRKLKELSGAHISFKQDEVNQQPNITVDLTDKSGRDVLDKILSGTSLVYAEGTEGNVLLVPRKTKKESVRAGKYFDVNGQVVDKQGSPLSNASIMVLPEKRGLTTNAQGVFNLTAKENDILRFSYLGMKTEDVLIRKDGFIKVELDTAPTVMSEYIVTGYQVVDKRLVTGAAVTLTPDKFLRAGAASVDQMLQGRVPGMAVTFNSGSPAASPKIRIRGTSTISGNAEPLWVVDGIIRTDPVNLNNLQVNSLLASATESNFSMVGNAISGVNPYDIESITFLKDAAATSIYGVQAANGVIVVKTKRGKPGPVSVSYTTNMGVTGRPTYSKMYVMNSKERVDLSRELVQRGIYTNGGLRTVGYELLYDQLTRKQITQEEFATKVGILETTNTDWFDLLAQNAFNQQHTIGISGGSGKTSYYGSLGFSDNRGAFKGDNAKLYTGRINLESSINNKLSVSLFLDASYRKTEGFFRTNPSEYATLTTRAIDKDSFYVAQITTDNRVARGAGTASLRYNILNELEQTGSSNTTQSVNLTAGLNYKLIKGLSYSGIFNMYLSNNSSFSYLTARSFAAAAYRGYNYNEFTKGDQLFERSNLPYGGIGYPGSTNNQGYTLRNQLNYQLNLFEGRDLFTAMVSQELTSSRSDGSSSVELGYYPERGNTYYSDFYSTRTSVSGIVRHFVQPVNTILNRVSYLGNISYTLNRKYTLTGSIRSDGSNRFGQFSNQRFLPNWSLGARWDLLSEKWFDKMPWINNAAVRASFGSQGNVVSSVGPQLIATYPVNPVENISNQFFLNLRSLPYPDLRWEKSKSWNIGIDLNFWNNRITFTADAYYKRTTDLLVSRQIPQEYGVDVMLMNAGTMTNKGWDATFGITPVKLKNFSWTQTFIYSMNYNSVVESGIVNNMEGYLAGAAVVPGKPYGSFYSYPFGGLSPVDGTPTYAFDTKSPGFDIKDPATFLSYSGRRDPLIDFSSSTGLNYKNFSFDAFFVVKLGGYRRLNPLYPQQSTYMAPPPDMNVSKELVERWRQPGDELRTNIPGYANIIGDSFLPTELRGISASSAYALYDQSTVRVVKSDFIRCSSISLGYQMPAKTSKKMGAKNSSVRFAVSNPFIITDKAFHGQDPEVENVGGRALPITSSYSLTFNVTF